MVPLERAQGSGVCVRIIGICPTIGTREYIRKIIAIVTPRITKSVKISSLGRKAQQLKNLRNIPQNKTLV